MVKINTKNTVTPEAADKVLISSDVSDANSTKQALAEDIAKTTKLDDLATPDDNTDLNATITEHGLCPKLSGNAGEALLGDGSWGSVGAGTGDVVGPATSNNNYFPLFSGATGKLLKEIGIPFYWDGANGVTIKTNEGKYYTENASGTISASLELVDGWPKLWLESSGIGGDFWVGNYDDLDTSVWTIGCTGANEIAFGNNASKRIQILSTGEIRFNTAYTFPTTDGTADQVLTTDGAGNLDWNDTNSYSLTKSMTTDATGVTAKYLVEMRKSNVVSNYLHVYKPGRVDGPFSAFDDDDIVACDITALNEHSVLAVVSDTGSAIYGSVGVRNPSDTNFAFTPSGTYTEISTTFGSVDKIKTTTVRENLVASLGLSATGNVCKLHLIRVNGYDIITIDEILLADTTAPSDVYIETIDNNTCIIAMSFSGHIDFELIKIDDNEKILRLGKIRNTDPVGDVTSISLSAIDNNSFIVAYNDAGSSTYGYLTHCQITHSNNIEFSSRDTFYSTAACNYIDVQMLSGNCGVVSYADTGSATNCRVKAFTYEQAGTFTVGSEIQPFSSATACTFTRLQKIAEAHFIILAKTNIIHTNTGFVYSNETIRFDEDLEDGGSGYDALGYSDATVGFCRIDKYKFGVLLGNTDLNDASFYPYDIQNPTSTVVGVATETKGASQSCNVCVAGVLTSSGYSAGDTYWSSATGVPSNSVSFTGVKMGKALSATEFLYDLKYYETTDSQPSKDFKTEDKTFKNKTNNWTKFSPPIARTSDTEFDIANADMNQMTYDNTISVGTPIRYRQSESNSWSYGIITALNADKSTWTIAGDKYTAAMQASATRQLEIGTPEKVISKSFFVGSTFANSSDSNLLANDENKYEVWLGPKAKLVRFAHRVKTADSGANQPRVNLVIDGIQMDQANGTAGTDVSTSWVYVNTDFDEFEITAFNAFEISTDANGSNNDASDLSLVAFFVLV